MGWIVIGAGLLVAFIAWLGKVGKLPRNHFVGIRLPSTMRSDEAWVAAHRAGFTMTLVSSLIMIAMGVRFTMVGEEGMEGETWWFIFPMILSLLIAALQGHRAAKRVPGGW